MGGRAPYPTPQMAPRALAGCKAAVLSPPGSSLAGPEGYSTGTARLGAGGGWDGGFTPPPWSPLSPLLHHVGEVIAIIFGTISSCLGLFLAIHFVAKRMR